MSVAGDGAHAAGRAVAGLGALERGELLAQHVDRRVEVAPVEEAAARPSSGPCRPWKISGMVSAFITVKVVLVSMDMFTPPCSPNS